MKKRNVHGHSLDIRPASLFTEESSDYPPSLKQIQQLMNDNSRQLLDAVLQQRHQEQAPDLSEQDYFEMFCAEQILKSFYLSYDELQAGIVDGEHDGGIDSAYVFVNGELVCEDFDTSTFKKTTSALSYTLSSPRQPVTSVRHP